MARVSLLGVWFSVMVGCGSGGSDGSGSDGAQGDAATDAGADDLQGQILVLEGGFLGPQVTGSLSDGAPVPWHTVTMTEGACQLLEFEAGFCDVCDPSVAICVDSQCVPWPSSPSAGTMTIDGLNAALSMEPTAGAFQYTTFGGLPEDLFDADAVVSATAPGAAFPAFTVSVGGVTPFETEPVPSGAVTLPDGADFAYTWHAPEAGTRVRVQINEGGNPHGTPNATLLVCDVPDTGSLTIPRALVEALPTLGPGLSKGRDRSYFAAMRYREGTVAVPGGAVTLTVASQGFWFASHE